MKKANKYAQFLKCISFMVIDIEDGTNEEIKMDVRRRLIKIIETGKKQALDRMRLDNELDIDLLYRDLSRICEDTYNNATRQFDLQIDELTGVKTIGNTVKTREYTEEENVVWAE